MSEPGPLAAGALWNPDPQDVLAAAYTPQQVLQLEQAVSEFHEDIRQRLTSAKLWRLMDSTQMQDPIYSHKLLSDLQSECATLAAPIDSDNIGSAGWLTLLRGIPDEVYWPDGFGRPVVRGFTEILCGSYAPERGTDARFSFGPHEHLTACRLIAVAQHLRIIGSLMRIAGKGVRFAPADEYPPCPEPTESQRAAIAIYDKRIRAHVGPKITVFSYPALADGDRRADVLATPTVLTVRRLSQPISVDATAWGIDTAAQYYWLGTMGVDALRSYVGIPQNEQYPRNITSLAMFLRLMAILLENNPYFLLGAGGRGYLSFETNGKASLESYGERYWPQLLQYAVSAFGDSEAPTHFGMLAADVDAIGPRVQPTVLGPIIHSGDNRATVDLVAAGDAIRAALISPGAGGPESNVRASRFEVEVQRVIDDSPWGDLPQELRALRGVPLLDEAGRTITDVDAIGLHQGVLLLIDCLHRVKVETAHEAGNFRAYRNDAVRLERKVSGRRSSEGWPAKCDRLYGQRGINFDFSGYTLGLAIVVSPVPIYVEESLVKRDRILSTQALGDGLYRACSVEELRGWLESVDALGAQASIAQLLK